MSVRTAAVLLVSLGLGACAEGEPPTLSDSDGPPRAAALASAGRWVSGTQASVYGARFYRLWVPAGYDGTTARPLLVMLHGCQQDGYGFAAGTRMNALADARGFLVLYPEQGTAYNAADCWNWFYPANQVRGGGEPSVIAGMIAWVKASYRVDAARVGAAGISAGGAMATIMGCTYPDQIRGVASASSVMYGAATTGTGGTNAMLFGSVHDPNALGSSCYNASGTGRHPMPVLVFHGSSDGVVNIANAHQTAAQWTQSNDRLYDGLDDNDVDATADATVTGTACRPYTRYDYRNSQTGATAVRKYIVSGLGHAWSGGSTAGSYADPCGPDASTLIVNFFGF